ncbi:hypothetical protein ACTXT7_017020 [Hymenolepis weldensis]
MGTKMGQTKPMSRSGRMCDPDVLNPPTDFDQAFFEEKTFIGRTQVVEHLISLSRDKWQLGILKVLAIQQSEKQVQVLLLGEAIRGAESEQKIQVYERCSVLRRDRWGTSDSILEAFARLQSVSEAENDSIRSEMQEPQSPENVRQRIRSCRRPKTTFSPLEPIPEVSETR